MWKCANRVALLVALLAASTTWLYRDSWGANLLYSQDFENGFRTVTTAGGCYAYSFSLVKSPVRNGDRAFRIINKGNANNSNCTDYHKGPKHRAEIKWGDPVITLDQTHHPYWIGWSTYIPSDFPAGSQWCGSGFCQVIVYQFQGGSFGPELAMHITSGDEWNFRIKTSPGPGTKTDDFSAFRSPIQRGGWTDWVINTERSWQAKGVTRVWKNGNLVYNKKNHSNAVNYVAWNNSKGMFNKVGIYWGSDTRPVDYILYNDNLRLAEGPDGYALVDPSRGTGSQKPKVPSTPTGVKISRPD